MNKEGYFILEGYEYDGEKEMRYQFHYWIVNRYFYSSLEWEDGTTEYKKRISEQRYLSALEEWRNC